VPLQTSQVFLTAIYCFQVSKSTVEDPRDSRRICSNGPLLQQVDARYLPIYLSSKLSSAFARAPSVKKGLAPVFSFLLPTKTIILETLINPERQPSLRAVMAPFAFGIFIPRWNVSVAFVSFADYSNIFLDIFSLRKFFLLKLNDLK